MCRRSWETIDYSFQTFSDAIAFPDSVIQAASPAFGNLAEPGPGGRQADPRRRCSCHSLWTGASRTHIHGRPKASVKFLFYQQQCSIFVT